MPMRHSRGMLLAVAALSACAEEPPAPVLPPPSFGPALACRQTVEATCKRVFQCFSSVGTLQNFAVVRAFGLSERECSIKHRAEVCSGGRERYFCATGGRFSVDNARACIRCIEQTSCQGILDKKTRACTSCQELCT